ncbi:uncharacterized protein LOC142224902 [Haematobia irritans]|uniref:uncharacterized protein LOC142224901 n=1 Tax=Haematobia irritans TaxID=7368 RepID=UPI003F501201
MIKNSVFGWDASENAYVTALYTRVQLENNSVFVNLLTSKSRVSPIKTLSIPKLALCGATLLAEVVDSVIPSLKVSQDEIYKWTDSTIVLAWLQKPACSWKVFVANRVSIIANKVGVDNWFHVDTFSNPADLATRGVYPKDLINCHLWWQGPPWLAKSPDSWPVANNFVLGTDLEQKVVRVHVAITPDQQDILERFSSYNWAFPPSQSP